MGALGRVLANADPYDDRWYGMRERANSAGVDVNADSIMTLPAFYAGVTLIAETIATVPLDMFQRTTINGQRGKQDAPNHPLDELLHSRPNEYQTAVEFREMVSAFAILRKFGIAEIRPGPRGPVDQLIPLHPDLVERKVLTDGTRVYKYSDPLKRTVRTLMSDEVLVLNSRLGMSLMEFAGENVGTSIAKQRYAGQLFSRGVRPQGALQYPGKLGEDARKNLRKALREYALNGQYTGQPLLLEDGMTWAQVGLTAADAQMVDSAILSIQDAARFLNLSPVKVGDLSHASYSNIEQIAIDFVTTTIRPWAVRWEQVISRDLIVAPQVYFAEHNLEGLNRGDILKRFQAYEIAIRNRWQTRNETRSLENRNPVAGGDVFDVFPTTGANPNQNQALANQLRLLVRDAAARAVRKETAAVAKLSGEDAIRAFYVEHAENVAKFLRVEPETATAYATAQADKLIRLGRLDDELDRIEYLTALATVQEERTAA